MGIGKKVEGAAKKAVSNKTAGGKGKPGGKKSGGGVEGKIKKALK
ncbi:hypothetical protein [Rubrobacter indicoceani]|nr:hypothetical protein [Rubrobacter indicoceani]